MADDLDDMLFDLGSKPKPGGGGSANKRPAKRKQQVDEDDDNLFGSDSEDGDAPPAAAPQRAGSSKAASQQPNSKRARPQPEEEEEEGDDDGYGSDLYVDDEDRDRLQAMTELDREMILADRAEKRDQDRQRRQLLQQQRSMAVQVEVRASGRRKAPAAEKDSALANLAAERERRSGKGSGKGDKPTQGDGPSQKARGSNGRQGKGDRSDEDAEMGERGRGKGKRGSGKGADSGDDDASDGDDGEFQPSEDSEERQAAPGSQAQAVASGGSQPAPSAAGGSSRMGTRGEPGSEPLVSGRGTSASGWGDEERGRDEEDGDELDGVEVVALGERRAREEEGAAMRDDEAPEDATLEELRSVCLSRSRLEAYCREPWFEGSGLSGSLVRYPYGESVQHPVTRQMVRSYLVMQIVEIRTTSKSYLFGPTDGDRPQQLTRLHLVLQDGMGITRSGQQMALVSNSPIEDFEYERYTRHCSKMKRTPISKTDVVDIAKKIHEAVNYRWDAGKVKELLQRKKDSGLTVPVNYAAEKAELKRRILGADAAEKYDESERLNQELLDLEAHAMGRSYDSRVYGMNHINKRNQQVNFDTALTHAAIHGKAGDKAGASDPFSRRATRSNIYWNTKGVAGMGEAVAAAELAAAKTAAEVATASSKLKTSQRKMDPAELIKTLDLDLDLSLIQGPKDVTTVISSKLLGPTWAAALSLHSSQLDLSQKTVLSVADWKRRAGYV